MSENNSITLKDGRKLGYAEYGDSKGAPLFFFHGWPSSRLQGKILDEAGQKLKIRIISTDRPGFGLSTFKENRKIIDWADDVEELADYLKFKKFAVLGQSGGGPYSAVCAFRLGSRITKAGICVGLAPTDLNGALEGMELSNILAWKLYNKFPFIMNLSSWLFFLQAKNLILLPIKFQFKSKSDQKILINTKVINDVKRIRKEAFNQGKRGCLADLRCYISDWGIDLEKIKTKVYLWYGDDDKNVSLNMGKFYHAHIKGSELKIYPGEGHLILNTHNGEILKKLRD